MKAEFSILRVIIETLLIIITAVVLPFLYYFYIRTFFESNYCKDVRREKNIYRTRYSECRDIEYNHKGTNFRDVIFRNPNSKFPDQRTIELDPITKEIINEYITS